jgi:hypothetical protein
MGHPVAKIDAKPLRDLINKYQISVNQIALKLGMSVSAIHQYNREGKMPAVMGPACRWLIMEHTGEVPNVDKRESEKDEFLIVRLPSGRKDEICSVLEALKVKLTKIEDAV